MRERLVHTVLADDGDLDHVLLSIEKNDSKSLTIKKTHFGTEIGSCLGPVDGERLTVLAQCHWPLEAAYLLVHLNLKRNLPR
jgi:hypothetical protein